MRRYVWLTVAALALAAAAQAVMLEQPLTDLVRHATLVVTGEVQSMVSSPATSDCEYWHTDVVVRVTNTVVGSSSADAVTVRYMGGQVGDIALVVEDQPTFAVGEEVVLFLAPMGDGWFCPDACQGKQTVVDGTALPSGLTLNDYLAAIAAAAAAQ